MGIFSNIRSYGGYLIKVLIVIAVIVLASWVAIASVRFATERAKDDPDKSQTAQTKEKDEAKKQDRDTAETKPASSDKNDVPVVKTDGSTADSTPQSETTSNNQAPNSSPQPQPQEDLPKTGPAANGAISAGLLTLVGSAYLLSRKQLKHALLDD